eukprot:GHUV01048963.1.p1 GENE.GHUV01048963.1~~GHUV01048963.1.p1  ORF type:complete len:111 (+),score=0.15 GHUV01048963.1:711-1043(+)
MASTPTLQEVGRPRHHGHGYLMAHHCIVLALAGITATLVCFPLDVLRTRLMAPWGHKYGGPLRTLSGMARCEGLGALYAGRNRLGPRPVGADWPSMICGFVGGLLACKWK